MERRTPYEDKLRNAAKDSAPKGEGGLPLDSLLRPSRSDISLFAGQTVYQLRICVSSSAGRPCISLASLRRLIGFRHFTETGLLRDREVDTWVTEPGLKVSDKRTGLAILTSVGQQGETYLL